MLRLDPSRQRFAVSRAFTSQAFQSFWIAVTWTCLLHVGVNATLAHDVLEHDITFETKLASISGALATPSHPPSQSNAAAAERPCIVIVGGTLSNTRDGDMARPGVPQRDALKRLSQQLATAGYPTLRYDKVGYGCSKPKAGWTGSYTDEAKIAAAAIEFARKQQDATQTIAIGESAGAYLLCLAAAAGTQADGYIFLGGHCGPGEAIYEYNFKRLADLADGDDQWREWVNNHARFELALGRRYKKMFAAAKAGKSNFEVVDGDFRRNVGVVRRKEEIDFPPDEMYRHITKPALALAGEFDLNVPPEHAARIVEVLRSNGNHSSTCVRIPQSDHNFQLAPSDEQQRLRERYSFDSFRREYSPLLHQEIVAWLGDNFGASSAGSKLPNQVNDEPLPKRAIAGPEYEPPTNSSPARLHLAPGVQLVEDIADKPQTAGVSTLEGEIGPLLLGEGCQAHYIDMPAGMYCEEHPHSNESIIYTVRGKWVLCSHGRRHIMKPGTLFHFAKGTPTGYETPFPQGAMILIFKGQRLTETDNDFVQYLQGMANRLEREHKAGVPYLLSDLPLDHPARKFAAKINSEENDRDRTPAAATAD